MHPQNASSMTQSHHMKKMRLIHELEAVTIVENMTAIGNNAFQSCSLLKNIKIPSSFPSIGDYTFYSCSELKLLLFSS